MRYPNYPPVRYQQPTQSVVEGYVNFFGEHEADHREDIAKFRPAHLRRIAMRIGRGCLIAANNNTKAAKRMFTKVRQELIPATTSRSPRVRREAAQLDTIASMLENSDNPNHIAQSRQSLHGHAVRDITTIMTAQASLDKARSPFRGLEAEMRGMLAQKVTLGLFTRYSHPYIMAMPALIHHDHGPQKRSNYDILLVESMPGAEQAATYKLQVKCECLGLCTERRPAPRPQDHYNDDITLVSACCDLQRGDDRSRDLRDFRVADLLIREYEGDITDNEVHELDGFTDSLMLSVTMGDQRRMGGIDPEEVYEPEPFFDGQPAFQV